MYVTPSLSCYCPISATAFYVLFIFSGFLVDETDAAETELLRRRCVELHEQLETNEQVIIINFVLLAHSKYTCFHTEAMSVSAFFCLTGARPFAATTN